jgi:hypothetical protein
MKKKETLDFGPDAIFDKLYGNCIEFIGPGHKYELCFMKKSTQYEKQQTWGGHNLGMIPPFRSI